MNKPLFPEVSVNGKVIASTAIAAETQNHSAPKGKPGLVWRKAARALAVKELLLQEAARHEIVAEPREIEPGRRETTEEALVRGLLDVAVEAAPPGEAEVRSLWEQSPDRYRSAPLWEVSHILCAADPKDAAAMEAARQRAESIAAQLKADPASFARIAGAQSECGSRSAMGKLGQLGPGDTVPEFEAALRLLSEGEITEAPVASRHGWHLIRMDALAPGKVLPFEIVQPRLAEAMEKAAWTAAARDFIDGLARTATIAGIELDRD